MATQTAQPRTHEEQRLAVPARLAAAWTSFMFLYLYVDYLALYQPGFVDEILDGRVHDFETGPLFSGLALTLIAIPSLMVVLSAVLRQRASRFLNLVVATVYIPITVYNAEGESLDYAYFYGLSIALELLLLAYILRTAWTWRRPS
jgi:hypothetical protein